MDFFCIERGTLFDNPSVVSLAEPERHSVHCLVDVAPCLASPYEVLYALPEASATPNVKHARGWRLDDQSKDEPPLKEVTGIDVYPPKVNPCGPCLARPLHEELVMEVIVLVRSWDEDEELVMRVIVIVVRCGQRILLLLLLLLLIRDQR